MTSAAPFSSTAIAQGYYLQQVFGLTPINQGASGAFQAHVTVGTAASGAQFAANDQTAFNAAVQYVNGLGGGLIEVMAGTYTATSEFVLAGSHITVQFNKGAVFQIGSSTTFPSAIVSTATGGTQTWTNIFVIASATDCDVYAPYINNLNTTNTSISGILVAGGNSRVNIYNARCTNMSRWARSVCGFIQLSTAGGGTVYDGGNDGVVFYSPSSDSCGTNGIPDGGGLKFFNGCSQGVGFGTNRNVTEFNNRDTNVGFTSFDTNPQNNYNNNWHENFARFGGYASFNNQAASFSPTGIASSPSRPGNWWYSVVSSGTAAITLTITGRSGSPFTLVASPSNGVTYTGKFNFQPQDVARNVTLQNAAVSVGGMSQPNTNTIANACFGVFVEAAFACATRGVKIFGSRYDLLGPTDVTQASTSLRGIGNTGLIIGVGNYDVMFNGVEIWDADVAWQVLSTPGQATYGGGHSIFSVRAFRCGTACKLDMNDGNLGSVCYDLNMKDCVADDFNSGQYTTGLLLLVSSSKLMPGLTITDCDFSRLANSTLSVVSTFGGSGSFTALPGAVFRNCPGITDQGAIATPVNTTTTNEIRTIGGNASSPTAAVAYQGNVLNLNVTSTGGTSTITIQHPDNSTLWLSSASSGTTAAVTASVWYYVGDASQTWSISGDPTVSVYAILPNGQGTVFANGGSTYSSLALTQGALITLSAFTGGPTVTVSTAGGPVATPFVQISSVSAINNITLPYASTVTWNTFSGSTITITQNGNAVANPFLRYREFSSQGSTSSLVANIIYEVRGFSMTVTASNGAGITVADVANNAIISTATDIQDIVMDPGTRISCTTSPSGLAAYARTT